MAAVETVVDLSRAPELTGTKSSQNGNLLQMMYGKELNCAKRVSIMVPDGAKAVSITLLEHLLMTCARNMRRRQIDPFTAIRNFIASYFPCFFSGDPSRFRIIMSSEGGERDSSFEELCKMADDVTDTEDGIAPDVPPYKIVLNAVRWKDLPPDEISKLLGVTVRQEKPWPYRDEFFLPG